MMDAEGSDRKTSPPFRLPSFDCSEGIFDSRLQETEVPWRLVHFFLRLEPKVFDLFGSYCVFVPKVLIRAF